SCAGLGWRQQTTRLGGLHYGMPRRIILLLLLVVDRNKLHQPRVRCQQLTKVAWFLYKFGTNSCPSGSWIFHKAIGIPARPPCATAYPALAICPSLRNQSC